MTRKFLIGLSIFFTLYICVAHAQTQDAYYQQGMQFFKLGRFEQAAESFSKVIITYPEYGEAYFYRGASYLFAKELDKAAKDLQQAEKLLKNNADVLLHLGYLSNETRKPKNAIKYFDKALTINPSLASAYNARGYSNQQMGNFRAALSDYSNAIRTDSAFTLAYNNRGSAIYYNQDVAEPSKQDIKLAIKDFEKALKLEPRFCLARRNKGLAYSFLGIYDSAINELTLAIACEPASPLNYMVRGSIYTKAGNYNNALNDLTKALEIKQDYAEAYIEMGLAKAYLGFTAEAMADFDKATALDNRLLLLAYYGKAVASAKNNDVLNMSFFLREAESKGHFKSRKNQKRLTEEIAFQPYIKEVVFKPFQIKLK